MMYARLLHNSAQVLVEQTTPASLLIFDAAASVSDLAFDDLDLDVSASAFVGFGLVRVRAQ